VESRVDYEVGVRAIVEAAQAQDWINDNPLQPGRVEREECFIDNGRALANTNGACCCTYREVPRPVRPVAVRRAVLRFYKPIRLVGEYDLRRHQARPRPPSDGSTAARFARLAMMLATEAPITD